MIVLNNTLSQEQMSLLEQLFNRGSFSLLSNCINGVDGLESFQTVAIAYAAITKGCLLNIDTGLGKTLIAAGVINVVSAADSGIKWIYLCQCSNLKTTADKMKKHLIGKSLVYCDSTENKLLSTFFTLKALNADVIVLSYEAIVQPVVESFLFEHREAFRGIILDESQMLSNLESHTSRLISAIVNSCEYKILLSATPLRISAEQVVNQMYMLDRGMFEGIEMQKFMNQFRRWSDKEIVGYKHLDVLQNMLMSRMLSISRTDLMARGDYTPIMSICHAGLKNDTKYPEVIKYKATASSSTMNRLIETVLAYRSQGKRGLIYANRNILKNVVYKSLASIGVSVGILDGYHTATQQAKSKAHQGFLDGAFDVMVTNITTGKDLPCDYIIFYELTFDYKQMLGRGERGLSGRNLDVVFVLTDTLYEMRFFYVNVYQRGVLLEQLCDKDMPELHSAIRQLSDVLARKGISLHELVE